MTFYNLSILFLLLTIIALIIVMILAMFNKI